MRCLQDCISWTLRRKYWRMSGVSREAPVGVQLIQKLSNYCCPRLQINRLRWYQAQVLVLTFFTYMTYHLTRKPISVVKSVLHQNCSALVPPPGTDPNDDQWCNWAPFNTTDANTLLGALDSAFLFSYAGAMFVSGMVAERVDLRYFLSLGMLMSAIFCYLFGIGRTYNIHNISYYLLVQAGAGIAQTTGWPGTVAIVGKWFGDSKKGLIFGIWNSHTSLGNILDDTALLVHGSDWNETEKYAQMVLNIVMNWFNNNLLTLNAEKTKLISFSLSNRTQPSVSPIVKVHSCSPNSSCSCPTLATTSCIKYLGVQIDKHLTWYSHIDNLVNRTRKLISIFKKLRCSADSQILMMVYYSLCQSLLLYCLPAWGGACKTYLLKLERAQRAVLKVMLCKPYRYPTFELFRESKVLTVRGLYVLQCVLRKHRLPYTESTKRRQDIALPPVRHKTTFAKHQFAYLSYILYNKINKLLNIYSLNYHKCKNIVKEWLLEKSYDETEKLLFPHT